LDQPLVNGFCRVCHEDSAPEVGLSQDIWQRCGMVHVETSTCQSTEVIRGTAWAA
jgi:hypothetical protein